jgi:hypothetical protein
MSKIHPLTVMLIGLLVCSMGFHILQWQNNNRLIYQIQKLEAGPARGLFLEPEMPKPNMTDEELNDLMKQILRKMLKERVV